ncbi:hypothetical protein DFQ26_006165 [Actinomortierella ambigua]|nr:hypothetical protein DFQ26_006165 [Actinomortierella ambigua]
MLRSSKATLLLLFVHGFKGHDHHTFLDFPNRIRTILTNANLQLDVEAIAYPQYDTRGDFNIAVKNFVEWVQMTVNDRRDFNAKQYLAEQAEAAHPDPKSRPSPVYVCFLGHSMGGLVAADAALHFYSEPQESPVVGLLAYDTPYLGLNNTIFTEAAYERANTVAKHATGAYSLVSNYLPGAAAAGASLWSNIAQGASPAAAATTGAPVGQPPKSRSGLGSTPPPPSSNTGTGASSWMSSFMSTNNTTTKTTQQQTAPVATNPSSEKKSSGWGWGSVALGVGAIVATSAVAIAVNKHVQNGMEWVTSHVQFVGTLWDEKKLQQRVAKVLLLPLDFHCFYTQVSIPGSASNGFRRENRTFIELKAIPESMRPHFSVRNCSGQDEIEAHTEMFNPAKNFDYYPMGEETVRKVRVMVEKALERDGLSLA